MSSGVIWTTVCMKLQKGGRGKVRDRENLFNADTNCHGCFLVLSVFFL